ncbi:hypothetical protein L6452_18209 [Arctium lappa]|uniref:Uncharacterized protein n=1 Tax=Arctium lappa TaxID=4217 RepID=A0ACB9C5K5_ARCLA|nr:hypothetical protein L6452_18209 [Arctium lappa]
MSLQAQIYKNDLMMSLGSDTFPPVLINENEFEQWQDRFINFIERQPNGENMMKSLTQGPMETPRKVIPATTTTPATTVVKEVREYDADEMLRHQADSQAKSNLILALPNSIYNKIDCFKQNPMLMWTQLEKIMLGTAMSTQLRQTRYMNNFEKFKAKDGESLKNVFDRFWAVINDLYKIKVTKTELEANLKFLNALQPEWNKSCHRMRNDVRISTMPIQELFEILMTDESMVMEKKAKMDKKNKPLSVDPIALLASQLAEQALTESAYDGSTDDDGEALEKAMILLTQHYQKRLKHKSGSNNLRFSSGSKKIEPDAPSKPYIPKYEPAQVVEQKKEEKKVINCFNCGKPGHIAKECRVKVIKDAAFYRKKLALVEKKESGTVLLAEEEYWLDHSDNEAENEETTTMCFIDDDNSDNEEEDTSSDGSDVISDFNYNFFLSQMNVFITALHDLRSKFIYEKVKNQENSDLINKLQISLIDEKSILIDTKEKFQKQLVGLENSNQTYHDSLTELTSSNKILSEKIIVLEKKLYKREQSEQTIYMNKPRSEEAIKEKWGLCFKNPHFLNNAKNKVPTLYEYDYFTLARYASHFKFFWTTEKQILEEENVKRMKNKRMEMPFVYTSENAKYFPDQSKKSRKLQNLLNDKSSNKSSLSTDFVDIFTNTTKENVSSVSYDTKKYIPSLVLEGKIIDLEDRLEEQNLQTCLENDLLLFIIKTSFEDKFSSGFSKDSKENTKVLKNYSQLHSTLETQTESLRMKLGAQNSVCASNEKRKHSPNLQNFENFHSKASSSMSNDKTDFFDKVSSSDSIIDNSFLLNAHFYKKKRKRRRSKKSKKHDTVLSENSNVSDFSSSDRTMRKSTRQIWRMKQQILESELLGVNCVENLCDSDTFASCNKIPKYSFQQMFDISKNISYASSSSDSDDCVQSSIDNCFHSCMKNKSVRNKRYKSNKGPISIWVPKKV